VTHFYERFRAEIARYADGVHRLGEPAPPDAVLGVADADLADFLRSWDGAELFGDAFVIRPHGALSREGERLWFGTTGTGDRLAIELDRGGRVVRLEDDSGELVVEGTSFARWLEATVVAEGVVYDREGEFQDDVFEGEAVTPAAAIKREKKALRIDPDAPGPMLRLARALERSGDPGGATRTLEALVARCPDLDWAWFDLGRLRREDGHADAVTAFARASECAAAAGSEHAAFFAVHAARTAAERGEDAARGRHAERALAIDPEIARGLRRAALARADEDDEPAEALELAELALALAPRDLEAAELRRRLSQAAARRGEAGGAERGPRPAAERATKPTRPPRPTKAPPPARRAGASPRPGPKRAPRPPSPSPSRRGRR
jgi:tetratricopeptide (TPR) repeat protein